MAFSTDKLKQDLSSGLAHLRTLSDEIRVELHLGTMEARDRWHLLEKKVGELERAAIEAGSGVGEATRVALGELIDRVKEFRSTLGRSET